MNININKDFEKEYKDDSWRGFSMEEVLYIWNYGSRFLFLLLSISSALEHGFISGTSASSANSFAWIFSLLWNAVNRVDERNLV